MKSTISFAVTVLFWSSLAVGRPFSGYLVKREVPQEHSHEQFLRTVSTSLQASNPAGIKDAVFGLLGDAAAMQGAGTISDPACLQQATADQAFTNAKAAGDVAGMTAALVYRALERNTGKVGQASAACTSVKAANPEIAAISQHQDSASQNAAQTNKAVTLALAKQIAAVGGDPQTALQSGTFAPGDPADSTAKGNTCDDANDAKGCIFTQNLLVDDATPDEVTQAAGGTAGSATAASGAVATTGGAQTAGQTAVAAPGESTDTIEGTAGSQAISSGSATNSNLTAASQAANSQATTDRNNAAAFQGAEAGSSTGNDSNAAAGGCSVQGSTGASSAVQATPSLASSTQASNLDLGSCSDPTIVFGPGFDGRQEDSFEPANKADFDHGSALNIGVISSFICGQLPSKCKAGQDAVDACKQGQQASIDLMGQAAADAFNAAVGSGSGGSAASTGINATTSSAPNATTSGNGASTESDVAGSAGAAPNAASSASPSQAASTGSANSAGGSSGSAAGNLQTFTGALGGSATPVTKSGDAKRPFEVKGDTFVNIGAALQRSCDQQFNACANAANSGSIDAAVSDCQTQKDACTSADAQVSN